MFCKYCGKSINDDSKFCKFCGNKLVIPEPLEIPKSDQISKSELEPKKDPYANNYKKIFNVCFYVVFGFIALSIFISFFRSGASPASVLGNIMDIFLNIWIWLFIIFIFIFRKTHKVWALGVSILFGFITILAAMSPLILPWLNSW